MKDNFIQKALKWLSNSANFLTAVAVIRLVADTVEFLAKGIKSLKEINSEK